jgi:hypothetical protein
MSEETITISQMIRSTSANTNNFLMQVADHIVKLEQRIIELEQELSEAKCNDVNM